AAHVSKSKHAIIALSAAGGAVVCGLFARAGSAVAGASTAAPAIHTATPAADGADAPSRSFTNPGNGVITGVNGTNSSGTGNGGRGGDVVFSESFPPASGGAMVVGGAGGSGSGVGQRGGNGGDSTVSSVAINGYTGQISFTPRGGSGGAGLNGAAGGNGGLGSIPAGVYSVTAGASFV